MRLMWRDFVSSAPRWWAGDDAFASWADVLAHVTPALERRALTLGQKPVLFSDR